MAVERHQDDVAKAVPFDQLQDVGRLRAVVDRRHVRRAGRVDADEPDFLEALDELDGDGTLTGDELVVSDRAVVADEHEAAGDPHEIAELVERLGHQAFDVGGGP